MTGTELALILLLGGLLGFIAGCLLIELLYVRPLEHQVNLHRQRLADLQQEQSAYTAPDAWQMPAADYEDLIIQAATRIALAGNDDWSKKAELRSVK